MEIFFSGAAHYEDRLAMSANQLLAQQSERRQISDAIAYKKAHPECKSLLMVDSGSFSLWSQHVKNMVSKPSTKEEYEKLVRDVLNVDGYIDYINNEIGPYVDIFVSCDIPTNPMDPYDDLATECTWDNYLYMYRKIKPEFRDKLCIVFHQSDRMKYLKEWLDYTHPESGKGISYLGVGVSLDLGSDNRIAWCQDFYDILKNSKHPDARCHAFGVGVPTVLNKLPWLYSADSTTYLKFAAYGSITINGRPVCVSDRQVNSKDYYANISQAYKESVEDEVKKRGWDIKKLSEDNYERMKFNVQDTILWAKAIKPDVLYTAKAKKLF